MSYGLNMLWQKRGKGNIMTLYKEWNNQYIPTQKRPRKRMLKNLYKKYRIHLFVHKTVMRGPFQYKYANLPV